MKKPPKKLSMLMKLALSDLAKVEKSDKYVVNMGSWHRASVQDNRCSVCFAGSIMAKSLKADPSISMYHDDFGKEWSLAFLALNEVRIGGIARALYYMGLDAKKFTSYEGAMFVPDYNEDPKEFRKTMRGVVKMLEKKGL